MFHFVISTLSMQRELWNSRKNRLLCWGWLRYNFILVLKPAHSVQVQHSSFYFVVIIIIIGTRQSSKLWKIVKSSGCFYRWQKMQYISAAYSASSVTWVVLQSFPKWSKVSHRGYYRGCQNVVRKIFFNIKADITKIRIWFLPAKLYLDGFHHIVL